MQDANDHGGNPQNKQEKPPAKKSGGWKSNYGVNHYIQPSTEVVLATVDAQQPTTFDIILDHGSTVNICSHKAAFSRMDSCKLELQWFNGNKVHVDKGTASYMLYDHLNKCKVQFTADMMLNPSGVSILSHARLVKDHGFKGTLSKDQSTFRYRNKQMLIEFKLGTDELYHMTGELGTANQHAC